jgi:hypothetical protein
MLLLESSIDVIDIQENETGETHLAVGLDGPKANANAFGARSREHKERNIVAVFIMMKIF